MARKSIGLTVLVIAVVAFVVASLAGPTTAAYSPLDPVPYYVALAATGQHYVPSNSGIPAWLIPALAAFGSILVVSAGLRLHLRRR